MIRKYVQYFKNMLKYIKSGGVVYANVKQVLPSEQFKGKKVLITGGSSGFGFQMAKDFIAQGAEVMITGRNTQKLDEAIEKINNSKLHTIVWDQGDCSCIIKMKPYENWVDWILLLTMLVYGIIQTGIL